MTTKTRVRKLPPKRKRLAERRLKPRLPDLEPIEPRMEPALAREAEVIREEEDAWGRGLTAEESPEPSPEPEEPDVERG